jgi:sec-independent protein translocase protein TatC
VIVGSLFFLIGAAFAQLVVIPFAMRFLVSFPGPDLTPMISVGSYVDFVLKFTLAFGAIFELPVAITLASRMGIVTPQFLAKNRKYAILLTFVVAAILTPTPDIFNQSLMAGPMILLYELGIISARIFGRRPKPAAAPVPEAAS